MYIKSLCCSGRGCAVRVGVCGSEGVAAPVFSRHRWKGEEKAEAVEVKVMKVGT